MTPRKATEPAEIEEAALGHALVRGVIIGVPLVFAAAALVSLLAGAGLGTAAAIAAMPALVAGPYAGGIVVLSRSAPRPIAEVRRLPARHVAAPRRRAAA